MLYLNTECQTSILRDRIHIMKCHNCNDDLPETSSLCVNCGIFISVEESPIYPIQKRVDFESAIRVGFRSYSDFQGRSSRAEFWWWTLFIFITNIMLWAAEALTTLGIGLGIGFAFGLLRALFIIGTLIPNISLGVRRLHDINLTGWWYSIWFVPFFCWTMLIIWDINISGWWLLLWIVPFSGWIIPIKWACQPSDEHQNKYGTPS